MAVTLERPAPFRQAPPDPARSASRPQRTGGARPQHLDGADALRALAAVAVIVVHTTHWALQDEGADAAVWPSVTLVARFCVPAFVLLTGLVLAYRYGEQPLGRDFLLRRARRSVLPWLIWAPIYCIAGLALTGEVRPTWGAVGDWWSLGGGHLYFLILVPQLYLLMLLWPARRRTAMLLAGAALALQVALCASRLYAPMPGGVLHQGVLNHGFEEFPFWIGFFAVGIAAGRMLAVRGGRGLAAWPFALAVGPAIVALLWLGGRGAANPAYADGTGAFLRPLMVPVTLAVCGSVLFGAPSLLRRMPRLQRATSRLSTHSLGVYIVHPLLIAGFGRILARGLHAHLPVSIAAVLALTVVTAVAALWLAQAIARTRLAVTIGAQRERRDAERERELIGRAA